MAVPSVQRYLYGHWAGAGKLQMTLTATAALNGRWFEWILPELGHLHFVAIVITSWEVEPAKQARIALVAPVRLRWSDVRLGVLGWQPRSLCKAVGGAQAAYHGRAGAW